MESLDTVASRLCTLLLMCAGTLLTAAGDGPAQNTSPNTTQAWPPFLAGQWSGAAARSPEGGTLYVCNRFKNCVSVIDVASGREVDSVAVQREPVAMVLAKDGKLLLVANFLQNGRADHDHAGAVISVIDTPKGEVIKELLLPDGSGSVTDLELSPDGKYAVATELVAQFKPPAVALEMRWMNGNAVTLIDVGELEVLGSVLLDDRFAGAANPSAAAWSGDGEKSS